MAKTINFTKKIIDSIVTPESGRDIYRDEKTRYLHLFVTPTKKVFYYIRKFQGRTQQVKLDSYPEMTPTNARDAAERLSGDFARGIDAAERKRIDRQELSFSALFRDYLENYAKKEKASWKEDLRKYKTILEKRWGNLRIKNITREHVLKLRAEIGGTAEKPLKPYQANRTIALIRKVFNFGIERGYLKSSNPAAGIKMFREHARSRYLLPHEMESFFKALDEMGKTTSGKMLKDFFLLCLYTGARRGNVQAMKWKDIDLLTAIWTIPAGEAKGRIEIQVPLCPEALEILKERKIAANISCPYVFPARNETCKTKHLSSPKKAWARLLEMAGLKNLQMHDLRRTLGSWMLGQGAHLKVIQKGLGHNDVSTTAKAYAHLSLDPVKQAQTSAVTAMRAAAEQKVNEEDTK